MSSGSNQAPASLSPLAEAYRGKRVWVTGHTGFKGAWLCEWLLALGADVTGYSLPAPTQPALSDQLDLRRRLRHVEADIRDLSTLTRALTETEPDFVFHLAAQPLVRESYADPLGTFSTNILGTANVLQALRSLRKPCAAVIVTSDKCYENRDWVFGYREEDALGGHDPYSASKGAAEIVIASMRRSFFCDHPVRVASARAGNVIGGGDWAKDRIVPDCVRALQAGQAIPVRNRFATRPWQHVLEPLSGYLWLAAQLPQPATLRQPSTINSQLSGAFNFGPHHDANRTVAELVTELLKHWPGRWEDRTDPQAPHEAKLLQLATDKAHAVLGWSPVWSFADAVEHTVKWYRASRQPADAPAIQALTAAQIAGYTRRARERKLPWAVAEL
ncbi:MAG: CDP-glucose 4,6-dehydratase [Verrucomicrobiota bacterium]